MNRNDALKQLKEETYDLCIIGAGASGAGCALDAALRGLKVALIDRSDFASETSGKSTKLIHGGVRYLEQAFKKLDFAQLRQVKHGLNERSILLSIAPHLTQPLGLVTPVFHWWQGLYYWIGLKLYSWFAHWDASKNHPPMPASKWLNKQKALQLIPGLSPRIHSAVLYYDGQMNDTRFALALIHSAVNSGNCTAANYLEVVSLEKNDQHQITAVSVKNLAADHSEPFEFNIRAKVFLNCTGPFADSIRKMANPDLTSRIRPSKGVHLTLPNAILGGNYALLIPKTSDGRMVFALPFEGETILGTTDEPYQTMSNEPVLQASEVRFLLDTLQPYLSKPVITGAVQAGFGGLRPLLAANTGAGARHTKSMLRDHEVETDSKSRLISLMGGKWTTYRIMAKDAVDVACRILHHPFGMMHIPSSNTQNYKLEGAQNYSPAILETLLQSGSLSESTCQHLTRTYGGKAFDVTSLIQENPELKQLVHPEYPFICAEIVYSVRQEMALSIRDFLARRIRLEILNWNASRQAASTVAMWMSKELNWTPDMMESNILAYQKLIDSFIDQANTASNSSHSPIL